MLGLKHQSFAGTASIVVLFLVEVTLAQVSELMRFDTAPHRASSGVREGDPGPAFDGNGEKRLSVKYSSVVRSPGVNMIRVHFGDFDLDELSEIHITSLDDGAFQTFTHEMLVAWEGWSAIFNGDTVLVQLLVAPEETAWFEITEIAVNDPPLHGHGDDGGVIATLCGGDNRVDSGDSRVGRLSGLNCGSGGGCSGCTAWLTSIGSAMTAGHCGNGSGGLIEFNVPQSDSNGSPNAADPNDQYPVGTTWYAFQNGGSGFDWAIMSVGPNSNTGLRAHWVQGYFHLTPLMPVDGTTLRITGFGVDNTPTGSNPSNCCAWDNNGNCTHPGCNSDSVTLQTSTGNKADDDTNRVFYRVDTEPANSGSPIIWNSNNFAVGVHTHGGCTATGGANAGTRLTQAVLSQWLGNFLDDNFGATVFVDYAAVSPTPVGLPLFPSNTVPAGVAVAPNSGTVAIAGGSYTAAAGNTGVITKAVTLTAVSGVVTIGN